MPIVVSAGDSKTFTPAPAGLHQAVCCDVVDMGILEVSYAGKTKKQHKVRLVWQLDEQTDELKPFIAQKRYTASLHEKANLRKDLESWRGRPFTDDELASFDLEKLLGANAQLNIQHVQRNGETYANVISIVPLGKGMQKINVREYVRVKDREGYSEPEAEAGMLSDDDIPF